MFAWFAQRVGLLWGTALNTPVTLTRRPLNVFWRCLLSLRCNVNIVLSLASKHTAAGEIIMKSDCNVWWYVTLNAFFHFVASIFLSFFLFFLTDFHSFPLITSNVQKEKCWDGVFTPQDTNQLREPNSFLIKILLLPNEKNRADCMSLFLSGVIEQEVRIHQGGDPCCD